MGWDPLPKTIAAKSRITIPDHPYLEISYSRKKSRPHLRLIHHKYRHAAVAVDCRSTWLSGAPIEHNAVLRSNGPAKRSRARPTCPRGAWGTAGGGSTSRGVWESQRSLFGLWRRLRRLLEGVLEPVGVALAAIPVSTSTPGKWGPSQALQLRQRPWYSFAQRGRSVAGAGFAISSLTYCLPEI